MSVSPGYLQYVLEQLGRALPVTHRSMFGGVGIYGEGVFFALIADDALYLKVGDSNRAEFEAAGSRPLRPWGDHRVMQYWELPADVLEEPETLAIWARGSLDAARTAKVRPAKKEGTR